MIVPFLFIVSAILLVYGALVFSGIHTPIRAKVMIEEEFRAKWSKTEGAIRMLWGLDIAVFALYYQRTFPAPLWLVCFLALTFYTVYITYKNNQKYMK